MKKLLLSVGLVSLAVSPVAVPRAANAQSAKDVAELCQMLAGNGGAYDTVGECVGEIRGLPVDRCQFFKLYLGFPQMVEGDDGEPVLVANQGECISHFRKHGGAR